MESNQFDNVLLFSLGSNPTLTDKVAALLGIPCEKAKVMHFADGEVFSKPMVSVTGKDIFIVHSTFSPANERLMELLVFLNALRNDNAGRIVVFIPYYGYARQDRVIDEGDPISALLVADLLKAAGADKLYTCDLHSLKIMPKFAVPTENLSAMRLFAEEFQRKLTANNIKDEDVTVVSPDHGGVGRAQSFAELLPGASFAYADKHRPAPNHAKVIGLHGDVQNKVCILVDDIIDTAGTMSAVCAKLLELGARRCWVAATHGVFSGNALERLSKAGASELMVSDTIENKNPSVFTISIAPLIAEAIQKEVAAKQN
jgi:ribose-phosphate pyrophosphokinase